MLNNNGFNLWADGYDLSVKLSEEKNEYPFAGYKDVLNNIYNSVKAKSDGKVLDIGFGTGILTKKLYDEGYSIHGIDFSREMIKIAQNKMPNARFSEWDFTNGLPHSFVNEKFDFIISTYAIHHLTDSQKVVFLNGLKEFLEPGGAVIIGDVAFMAKNDLISCKNKNLDIWDNDEIYVVYDLIGPQLCFNIKYFKQVSFCAGIINLS